MEKVLLVLSSFATIYSVVHIIYKMIKGRTLKQAFASTDFKILSVSLLLVFITLFPWHKIHYGDPEKVIIRDTKIIKSPPETVYVAESASKSSSFQFEAPISGNNQIGNDNIQNNFTKPDRGVSEELIAEVLRLVADKDAYISIAPISGDRESLSFIAKNIKALKDLGYKNAYQNGTTMSYGPADSILYEWDGKWLSISVPSQ